MSETIRVRTAKPDDHPQIARLTVDVYVGEGFSPPDAEKPLSDLRQRLTASEVLVAVNEQSGETLGAVSLVLNGGPLAQLSRSDEAEVRFLAVDHQVRMRGVGEVLTRECIRMATEARKGAIVLSTQPTMEAAQRLYQRLGFVRTPSRDWRTLDGRQMLAFRLALPAVPPVKEQD